jgi:hypothetical protein
VHQVMESLGKLQSIDLESRLQTKDLETITMQLKLALEGKLRH